LQDCCTARVSGCRASSRRRVRYRSSKPSRYDAPVSKRPGTTEIRGARRYRPENCQGKTAGLNVKINYKCDRRPNAILGFATIKGVFLRLWSAKTLCDPFLAQCNTLLHPEFSQAATSFLAVKMLLIAMAFSADRIFAEHKGLCRLFAEKQGSGASLPIQPRRTFTLRVKFRRQRSGTLSMLET